MRLEISRAQTPRARALKFVACKYAKHKRRAAILARHKIVGAIVNFELIHNRRARYKVNAELRGGFPLKPSIQSDLLLKTGTIGV